MISHKKIMECPICFEDKDTSCFMPANLEGINVFLNFFHERMEMIPNECFYHTYCLDCMEKFEKAKCPFCRQKIGNRLYIRYFYLDYLICKTTESYLQFHHQHHNGVPFMYYHDDDVYDDDDYWKYFEILSIELPDPMEL
jgi:hypothetical protein